MTTIFAAGAGDEVLYGAGGADTLRVGSGTDRVTYYDMGTSLIANFKAGVSEGDADGDQLFSFEVLEATPSDDLITFGSGEMTVWGRAGTALTTSTRRIFAESLNKPGNFVVTSTDQNPCHRHVSERGIDKSQY